MLKFTLNFAIYFLSKKLSFFISNDSIKYLISLSWVFLILILSFVVTTLEANSLNAEENALLITFSLLNVTLNGSDISMSFILKILLFALVIDNETKIKVDK